MFFITLFMYLCYVTGTLQDVVGGKIQWNPDTQGITFTTNSAVGSDDEMSVRFYDTSIVYISFSTPMRYLIGGCIFNYNNFPVSLPAAPEKTWTITYNTAGKRLALYCNGVQVLNFLLSDSECTRSDWSTVWERKPTQIKFGETASDSYCFSSNTGKYNEVFQEA